MVPVHRDVWFILSQYSAILEEEQKRQPNPGWDYLGTVESRVPVCNSEWAQRSDVVLQTGPPWEGSWGNSPTMAIFEAFSKEFYKHISSVV